MPLFENTQRQKEYEKNGKLDKCINTHPTNKSASYKNYPILAGKSSSGDDSRRVSILGACCKDMDRKTTIEPT